MTELAIKGHETRGKEVIELLEMLGGKNKNLTGAIGTCVVDPKVYFIENNNIYWYYYGGLDCDGRLENMCVFTLEEFEEKFPYKVGDKVHIYVQNDDIDGRCEINVAEISSMRWNPACRKIAYKMKDINREFYKEEIKCKADDDSNKMIDIKPEDLLTARNVLTNIMKEHNLNYNNAFTHVKNYITNLYCDMITENHI